MHNPYQIGGQFHSSFPAVVLATWLSSSLSHSLFFSLIPSLPSAHSTFIPPTRPMSFSSIPVLYLLSQTTPTRLSVLAYMCNIRRLMTFSIHLSLILFIISQNISFPHTIRIIRTTTITEIMSQKLDETPYTLYQTWNTFLTRDDNLSPRNISHSTKRRLVRFGSRIRMLAHTLIQ